MSTNWQCPHCFVWSALSDDEMPTSTIRFGDNAGELSMLNVEHIVCKNAKCQRLTVRATLRGLKPEPAPGEGIRKRLGVVSSHQMIPISKAKPQPPYIPEPIIADYNEAYLISTLSPKASATLSRRCLQGMIRDFFSLARPTLFEEISAIKDRIPVEVWEAIHAVRSIGNIGAHMEKDIDVIIDVDEGEANLLLELIEQLFDDWYVTRHKRQERLDAIKGVASDKKNQKNGKPSAEDLSPRSQTDTQSL